MPSTTSKALLFTGIFRHSAPISRQVRQFVNIPFVLSDKSQHIAGFLLDIFT